jgi:hypothetical protein
MRYNTSVVWVLDPLEFSEAVYHLQHLAGQLRLQRQALFNSIAVFNRFLAKDFTTYQQQPLLVSQIYPNESNLFNLVRFCRICLSDFDGLPARCCQV